MVTYLLINFLTIIFPLVFSFERKHLHFLTKWKYLFPAILLISIPFIWWDQYFATKGIWGFNSHYLIGLYLGKLPVEEILFFLCIPFSSLFIYEVVKYRLPNLKLTLAFEITYLMLASLLLGVSIGNVDLMYTEVAFSLLTLLIACQVLLLKSDYLAHFMVTFALSLIPFLIVNGILTNGLPWIDHQPIVWYNNNYNLGIRMLGIPLEDFAYSMLLLLGNVTVYEWLQSRLKLKQG